MRPTLPYVGSAPPTSVSGLPRPTPPVGALLARDRLSRAPHQPPTPPKKRTPTKQQPPLEAATSPQKAASPPFQPASSPLQAPTLAKKAAPPPLKAPTPPRKAAPPPPKAPTSPLPAATAPSRAPTPPQIGAPLPLQAPRSPLFRAGVGKKSGIAIAPKACVAARHASRAAFFAIAAEKSPYPCVCRDRARRFFRHPRRWNRRHRPKLGQDNRAKRRRCDAERLRQPFSLPRSAGEGGEGGARRGAQPTTGRPRASIAHRLGKLLPGSPPRHPHRYHPCRPYRDPAAPKLQPWRSDRDCTVAKLSTARSPLRPTGPGGRP